MSACQVALNLPEVLACILGFTINQSEHSGMDRRFWHQNRGVSTADPPWPFLRVCKHWRAVTLSTPQLWSIFHVELYQFNYADAAHLPALLDTYLHRSKNVPITLTILLPLTFGSTGTPSPTKTITEEQDQVDVVHALLQKATESQKRWKDVVLGMIIIPRDPMDPSAPVNFTIRLDETKALNQLTIVESLGSVFLGSRRIVLGQCPQLETIKLVGPLEVIDPGSSEQHVVQADYFPKLRSINLSDFKHKHCWKFLQYASHAEDLVLNFFEHLDDVVGSPFPTGKPLLELPKLRSMLLHSNAEDRNATQILNYLSLPSLTMLKMQNRMLCDDTFTDFSVALDRFRLTRIKIDFDSPEDEPGPEQPIRMDLFLNFLESLKEVRFLTLKMLVVEPLNTSLANILAAALVRPSFSSGPNQLLPHLVSLNFGIKCAELYRGESRGGYVKDLILACHSKYPSRFALAIKFEKCPEHGVEDEEVEKQLHEDLEILECVMEHFEVRINGVELSRKQAPFQSGSDVLAN